MPISPELRNSLIQRYSTHGLSLDQALLERIIDEVADSVSPAPDAGPAPASPFDVSWMDSYLAHWTLGQNVTPTYDRFDEVAQMLRDAMDARFEERKADILQWIHGGFDAPDGGPPEPGAPPAGPATIEAPDGGPPEPGVPPVGPSVFEPPDGGSPEPGAPPAGPATIEAPDGGPPEPGVPPIGPEARFLGENPWILYWFVSLKAPMLLDVIDAHLMRRLGELGFEQR
jgi:hypothetical protein